MMAFPPLYPRPGEVEVIIDDRMAHDDWRFDRGRIVAGSMSAILAQIERERRRMDCVAAFAPEQLGGLGVIGGR